MTLNSISSTYTMHKSLRSLTLLRKLCLTNELNETKGFIPFISQLQRRAASSGRFDDQDYDDSNGNATSNRFIERSEEWDHDDAFMRKRTHMQRRGGRDFRPPQRNHRFSFRDEDFDHQDEFDRRMHGRSPLGSRLKTQDWNEATLGSFEKNFYVSHPSVSTRSQEEVDAFYEKHNITVNMGERPTPVSHFQEANFPDPINHRLKATGWSEPTPIQSIGWPLALSGKNMVGVAQTGSGKTLGFLLPALVHIRHQRPVERGGAPLVVVLAPTRELAQQIQGVASQFCRPLGIRSCCVFGGQSKLVQAKQLMKGQELVVATPGRLIDFVEDETICLGRTTYVVLDEADRMLDMGFEPQIRKILSQIRPDRQILMWTATWPEEIQSLAHDFLGDFTQINIGSTELTVNPNIKQAFRICDERDKFHRLLKELRSLEEANDHGIEKTLIFTNTQAKAENIARKLKYNRFYAKEIHGRKSQSYRELVLDSFRSGRLKVLVATDVAARGLDVDDVKVVINYDLPTSIDDYIHRIGRTARASKSGSAVSFCTDENGKIASDLVSTLQRSDQDVDPELKDLAILYNKYKKGGNARKGPSRYPRQGNYQSHFRRKGYGQQNMHWKGKDFY